MIPSEDTDGEVLRYKTPMSMRDASAVYAFTGISIDKLFDLDIYSYRVLLINTVVNEILRSENGVSKLNRFAELQEEHTEYDPSLDSLECLG